MRKLLFVSLFVMLGAVAFELSAGIDRSGSPPGWDHVADANKQLVIAPSGNLSWKLSGGVINAKDIVPDTTCTADASTAINAAIAAMAPTGNASKGVRLFMPKGCYRVSSPIRVSREMVLYGDGGGGDRASTIIQPDKNVTGIIVDRIATSPDGGMGDFSTIQDISVQYASQTTGVWAPTHAYVVGDTVSYKNSQNLWATFVCSGAGTSGSSEPNFSGIVEGSGEGTTISDGSVTWTVRVITAIRMYARAKIDHVFISQSPGNGIHINASVDGTPSSNANGWTLRDSRIIFSALNGLYVRGNDANAGLAEATDVSLSYRGWGFYDASFLGNTYLADETADNYLGAYATNLDNVNARNVYMGCYSEGGQPGSQIQKPGVVIGGLHGAGFASGTGAPIFAENALSIANRFDFQWLNGGSGKTVFHAPYADGYPFAFSDTTGPTGMVIAMRLGGANMFGGNHSWTMLAENADTLQFLDFSGKDNTVAGGEAGHIGTPHGLWFTGDGPTTIPMICSARKPETFSFETFLHPRGTLVWNGQPTEQEGGTSGILGWQKVHVGIYSASGDYVSIRTPHFGVANTMTITNTVGSPHVIDFLNEAGVTYVNDGATAKVGFTLPPISTGIFSQRSTEYGFYVTDSDGMRLTSWDTGRKIKWGNQAVANYIESTTIGSWLKIKAEFNLNTTPMTFIVTEMNGVWTDDNGLVLNEVSGPASATTGNVSTFADGTGARIQDSGTALSSLRPKDTYGTYTATGTVQGTCTPITTTVANVTSGDNKAVCLPASSGLSTGDVYEVLCSTSSTPAASLAHTCLVFPASGDTISPLSANAADTMPAQTMTRYRFKGSNTWAAEPAPMKTDTNNHVYGTSTFYNGATVTGTITMAGSAQVISYSSANGNQLNFTTCDGSNCFNQISVPDGVSNALRFRDQTNGTVLLDFVTASSSSGGRHLFTQLPMWGTPSTVAATGSTQADATAIARSSVMVNASACNGAKGVALPSGSVATAVRIMARDSTVTNACLIWPNNNENDTINGAAADASYTQPAGTSLLYQTDDGTNWFTY